MDCCSSSSANYLDYRHHSMNNNFCYPYTPSMLRSASPYPMAAGGGRYGGGGGAIPDAYHHRSGYGASSGSSGSSSTGGMGGYHDNGGYEKYYGSGYHHHPHHHPHHSAGSMMGAMVSGHGGGGSYGSSGYYGSYSSSYREYGGYNHYYQHHHHHHHQSQSPYSRGSLGGMPPGYGPGGGGGGAGGYLYPPGHRHMASANPSAYPYHHQLQRDQHHQYSSFANYGNGSSMTATSYRSSLGSLQTEQSSSGGSKAQQQQQQQQHHHQHGYSTSQGFGHNDRASNTNQTDGGGVTNASGSSPSTAATSLFQGNTVSNGFSTAASSSEYSPLSASYGPADSPQLPLQQQQQKQQQQQQQQQSQNESTAENGESPTPTSATADYHLPLTDGAGGGKDTSKGTGGGGGSGGTGTTRKPKERKHQRAYGNGQTTGGTNGTGNGGSETSRTSSPTAALGGGGGAATTTTATASSSSSNGGASAPAAGAVAAAGARMKSLDALTNLCWPDGEQFTSKMRKYSNAGGTKAKDTASNRKQDANELDLGVASSPSRANGTGRRTKKQTKQQKELKSSDAKDKQTNTTINATPPVENKNITPLPGFQQAFGSTEIGKFSEAFFNSSPTPNDTSTPEHHHHPLHHHHHHHLSEQQQHQQQQPTPQQQQQLQLLHHSQRTATPHQQAHHQLSGGTVEQLLMDSLHTYESDVDTLSPQQQQQQQQQQPWDHAVAPGTTMASLDRLSSYESCHNGASISSSAAAAATAAGYNLQIGTSFHPSYYESSSYSSDHAVDSPLGSYFSEMTCNEFVN